MSSNSLIHFLRLLSCIMQKKTNFEIIKNIIQTVAEGQIRHEGAIRTSTGIVCPIMGRFAPLTGANWCTEGALFLSFQIKNKEGHLLLLEINQKPMQGPYMCLNNQHSRVTTI